MTIIDKCRLGRSLAAGRARWIWAHRTKALGLAGMGVAYVQANLAQLGHFISPQRQGLILGAFGVAAFLIGLYNTFAPAGHPEPPAGGP